MDGPGLAGISTWPVRVTAGPIQVTLPPMPARRWIAALIDHDFLGIVPGLAGDNIVDAFADGTITVEQCETAARHALAAVTGMPWWVAVRLIYLSTAVPGVCGDLVLAGVDAATVSVGAWCAATYRIITRDREMKDVRKVDWELSQAPDSVPADELYDPARAAAAFDSVGDMPQTN